MKPRHKSSPKNEQLYQSPRLELRDEFAIQVLASIRPDIFTELDISAMAAYAIADALIKERNVKYS